MKNILTRFESYRGLYWPMICELVDRLLAERGLGQSSISSMWTYQEQTGGKRLRAILPLLVAESMGLDPESLVPFGAACELIHNATLVHDDIQDGDEMRRDQPALWCEFGEAQAINFGDALLYLAPLCLDHLKVPSEERWALARKMFSDILRVIDGQEREFLLQKSGVSFANYEAMVSGKTSGLFSLPLVGAAQIGNADREIIASLEKVSQELGILFQMQDDILDLYGEKGRAYKGTDIEEGKISLLVIAFKECASSKEFEMLMNILLKERGDTTKEDVSWAIESFRTSGALAVALKWIEERKNKILQEVDYRAYPELETLIGEMIDLFLHPIAELKVF